MDIILLIFIVLLLVADMHRHMKMLKLQEKDETRTKELSAILEAMKNASIGGGITSIRPTDELVRLVFSEYLKVYLQKRLDVRIDDLNKRGLVAIKGEEPELITFAEYYMRKKGSSNVKHNTTI